MTEAEQADLLRRALIERDMVKLSLIARPQRLDLEALGFGLAMVLGEVAGVGAQPGQLELVLENTFNTIRHNAALAVGRRANVQEVGHA